MPGRPPLDLHAEVTLADGSTYRWDAGARLAQDRPRGIVFRTKKGDGFADASLTLSRRIDRDWIDVNLLDGFALVGYDGSVAYEGRTASNPRSLDAAGHRIALQLQGWMSHAKQRKFRQIFVDRDLSQWRAPGNSERSAQLAAAPAYQWFDFKQLQDAGGLPALATTAKGPWVNRSLCQAWYDAGDGLAVAAVYYDFTIAPSVNSADANWSWTVGVRASDVRTAAGEDSANLRAASGAGYYSPATARRFVDLVQSYAAAAGGNQQDYDVVWRKLAAYGNHGLPRRALAGEAGASAVDPGGFYVSDMLAWIAQNYAPKLSTAGIQATTTTIPQAAYRDPIFPYDAFLDLNKYHLWSLAVWENRTLTYKPYDLTDYDWEIRLSDPGVEVDLQGDSVGEFANGICVSFTDVATGRQRRITPADDSTLSDSSPNNPANQHGETIWTELALSFPTTAAVAAAIGRAALAEYNLPKGPGTIRIRSGYVRDRAGHWQQAWKVRADQRIVISDHPNDRVRLVGESEWSHDQKLLTLATDSTLQRVDAVQDRAINALQARNLL